MSSFDRSVSATAETALWDRVNEYATVSVHPRTGILMGRIVWRGEPLTSVGATSSAALRDLFLQVQRLERG